MSAVEINRELHMKVYSQNVMSEGTVAQCCMRFYRKVSKLGQKRNAGLTYSILAAISFKIVS
jgi:hypothetical protein